MNMQHLYQKSRLAMAAAALLSLSTFSSNAQVKIGLPAGAAAASAVLDASNTGGGNKGFLAPQVALSALNVTGPVVAPAAGLLVYNTATAGASPNNVVPGYYYYNGSQWVSLVSANSTTSTGNIYSTDGTLTGARTVTQGANNLTFNSSTGHFIFNPGGTGNMGIGSTSPTTRLAVNGSVSSTYLTPNTCGCVTGGINSTVPVTTSQFTMFNANFSLGATLPTGATEGQVLIMSSGATLTYTIAIANTNLTLPLAVATNQAYQFVFIGGRWLHIQ